MPYQSTKRGRPIQEIPKRKFGFNFFGHDDKGVAIWRGNPASLIWGVRVLVSTTTLFALASIGCLLFRAWDGAAAMALGGIIHGGLAFYMRQMHHSIGQYDPTEELKQELHVNQAEIDRIADQYQVKPRMIINGRPYYSAEDFDEAARLLRAARSPTQDALLRPAAACETADEEVLLRPSGAVAQPTRADTISPNSAKEQQAQVHHS